MTITIPKDAAEYFDKQADELLLLLYPASPNAAPEPGKMMSDDHRIKHKLETSDLIGIKSLGSIDGLGNKTSRYFQSDRGPIGFQGERYLRFAKLLDQLAGKAELRKVVGKTRVEDIFFEWFEKRYNGQLDNSNQFTNYFFGVITNEIRLQKISIPISHLSIETAFEIGRVTFEYFTAPLFDNIEKIIYERNPDSGPQIKEYMSRTRKRYQGIVFASINLEAERSRGIEIAKEETEKALTILRFFSPWALVPEATSYFGRMGRVTVPTDYMFVFEDGFPEIIESVEERKMIDFPVRAQDLMLFSKHGLDQARNLIIKEKLNDLEMILFNSIDLFSRSVAAADFHDKLVYCIVSLETLLLKRDSEPIQSSVGLRSAFLAAQSVEKRKQVIKYVKKAYKLRSAYVHHGSKRVDIETLRSLRITAWSVLRAVLLMTDKYATQQALLEAIEERSLSG